MKTKIIIDISPLDLGQTDISNGIARTTWHTINTLKQSKLFHIYFYVSDEEKLNRCKEFIEYDKNFNDIEFVNDGINFLTKLFIKIINSNLLLSRNGISEKASSFLKRARRRLVRFELENTNIYVSTFFEFPLSIKRSKKILKYFFIYDLIPIKFPHYFELDKKSSVHYLYNVLKELERDTNVIAISNSTKNDFIEFRPDFPVKKISLLYLAANESFKPCYNISSIKAIKSKYKIPQDAIYIISNSTLEIRKNIDHLIKSYVRYIDKYKSKNVYLVLTGKGGWSTYKIEKAYENAENLKSRIIFTGYVPDQDLSVLYSGALCFAYMSLYEGFGLPPLEAMQSGCPVITSNNSSLPEVVGGAGILLENNDENALVETFNDFYTGALSRKEFSKRSILFSKNFSWNKYSESLTSLIQNNIPNKSFTTKFIQNILSSEVVKNKFKELVYNYESNESQLIDERNRLKEMVKNLSNLPDYSSFSQSGEDQVVSFIFRHFLGVDIYGINYVDVGMNDPILLNNTYYYYKRNGKGVLIEPNINQCLQAKVLRPVDVILNTGINCGNSNVIYYELEEKYSGLNTFSKERAATLKSKGYKIVSEVSMKLIELNDIFDKYFVKMKKEIHFVSIDVEGLELNIVERVNFDKYRPWVYCIESDQENFKYGSKQPMVEFMENKDYVYVANTSINMIFVAKERFSLKNFVWFKDK